MIRPIKSQVNISVLTGLHSKFRTNHTARNNEFDMSQVPDHYFNQSAVIPVRKHNGRLEVLLISSRKRKHWVIPKGVKEPELSGPDSAAKEALEEAGIEGDVEPDALGTYRYDKWGGTCTVDVYLMFVTEVHDAWEEQYRDREWVDVGTAVERLQEPDLKKIVDRVPQIFASKHAAE